MKLILIHLMVDYTIILEKYNIIFNHIYKILGLTHVGVLAPKPVFLAIPLTTFFGDRKNSV